MNRKSVAVLISGSGSNLQALINACEQAGFPARIALVISNRTDAFGLERAKKAGIPTQTILHTDFPDRASFDAALHQSLVQSGIDIICLAGFMRILSADFVQQWTGRMLNIHPSLLPAFKGLHTHRRAIEEGVKFAGCTVHLVVPDLDAGPIISQAVVPVLPDDTEQSLAARVLIEEHKIYPQALQLLAENKLVVQGQRVSLKQ